MARTVYEGFQEYLARLEPKATEVDHRKSHKKTIEQAIAADFPHYSELLVIGSTLARRPSTSGVTSTTSRSSGRQT